MKPSLSLKDSLKEECERREKEKERSRMSRDRDRFRERDRENDRREKDRREMPRLPRHLTASADDPKLLMSRVFIGNLPTENMIGNTELENIFDKYGKILGVNMLKGYGFVQFEREEDARQAIEHENASLYKGYRIDVKMAAEGRGGGARRANRRPSPPPRQERERSPMREPIGRGAGDDHYRRPPIRDRHSPPMRDPYMDRGPFRRDHLLPPPIDPPFREPPAPIPLHFDAMLIVSDPNIRGFGEALERRLSTIRGMLIDFNILRDPIHLPKALEEASHKKMLYAIVINEQNETHRSLTLNVLHGTPQEHRNMPLEDALSFVSRNFAEYLKEKELKAIQAAPPVPAKPAISTDFTPPDKQTSYLLNLLADNRFLTVEELDNVIDYLLIRREQLAKQTGAPARKISEKPHPGVLKDEQAIAAQQQELQQKILNILNGSNSSSATQAPATAFPAASQSGPTAAAVSTAVSPTNINFDNPSVQRALDNLISGGSSLLKNIAAVKNPGAAPAPMGLGQRSDPFANDTFRGTRSPVGREGGPPPQVQSHDPYASPQPDLFPKERDPYGGAYTSYPEEEELRRGAPPAHMYGRRY